MDPSCDRTQFRNRHLFLDPMEPSLLSGETALSRNTKSADHLPTGFHLTQSVIFTHALALALSLAVSVPSCGQDAILDMIERNLELGRNREAMTGVHQYRRHIEEKEITPAFLMLEAKVLLANGRVEEAQERLEVLRMWPGWEESIDPSDLLTTEIQVLRFLGKTVDAMSLLESKLPQLDKVDPPYSPETTQLYHLYADLLFASSHPEDAVETLLDLLSHGEQMKKPSVVQSLLRFAKQGVLNKDHLERISETLEGIEDLPVWHEFSKLAHEMGETEVAKDLLEQGIEHSTLQLRGLWERFLEEVEDDRFLEFAVEIFKDRVGKESNPHLRFLLAVTLEGLGRGKEALDLFEGQLTGDIDLQLFAARVYAANGDIASASKVYAELERAYPGSFLRQWGTLLADLGKSEEACEVWARIPSTSKNPLDGYRSWGRLLNEKGFLEEARNAYLEGIEETNRPELFATELLDVSLALGDVEQALSAYQNLRKRSPQSRLTWNPLRLRSQLQRTQQVESFSESLNEVLAASGTERAEWRDFAIELQTDLALHLNETQVFESWLTTPPRSLQDYWNASPGRKNDHMMMIALDLSTVGEDRTACEFFKQLDRAALETRLEVVEAAARSSANINETSASLEYWEILWNAKRSNLDKKQKATLEMARLHLKSFRAGKALEWLQRVPSRPRTPSVQAEKTFLEGLAYTQLHEERRAIPLLEEVVQLGRNHSAEALFWLAEWSLWKHDSDRAQQLYRVLLGRDPGQDLANECLWRLRHLGELDEDHLPIYSIAAFFEAGGEFAEAEKNYRKLAASMGPCDLTDWAYYRIGKIKIESGNREEGFAQWHTLLETCDNPTLVRRVRFEMASLSEDPLERDFENIAIEAEDTLLGDLARKRMNETPLTPRPVSEQMVP